MKITVEIEWMIKRCENVIKNIDDYHEKERQKSINEEYEKRTKPSKKYIWFGKETKPKYDHEKLLREIKQNLIKFDYDIKTGGMYRGYAADMIETLNVLKQEQHKTSVELNEEWEIKLIFVWQ